MSNRKMKEYFILKEGTRIVYEGTELESVRELIEPRTGPPSTSVRRYSLSTIRIKDGTVFLFAEDVFRYENGGEVHSECQERLRILLNDLEKLLEKTK